MALVNSKIRSLDTADLVWSFQELLLSPAPFFCPFLSSLSSDFDAPTVPGLVYGAAHIYGKIIFLLPNVPHKE